MCNLYVGISLFLLNPFHLLYRHTTVIYPSMIKDKFYLSVKDSGIGISDEEKKKVFDRFYRAEKSRSTKGHFGLGLSIAYDIIKAHNGSIRVTDAEGGGAVFTVILPV